MMFGFAHDAGIYFASISPISAKWDGCVTGRIMKTVDQLVSEWTEEERENLKDLIEECRERERKSLERMKRNDENLTKVTESLQSFLSSLYEIKEKTERLADDLLGIYLHFYHNEMASS